MKEDPVKRLIKVKHTEGVLYRGSFFKYEGLSRVDNLPLYSYTCVPGEFIPFGYHFKFFVFNCKPHYTPTMDDFEPVSTYPSIDEDIFRDTFEIKPLSPPTGLLYAMDVIYEEQDPRLLLMLQCSL